MRLTCIKEYACFTVGKEYVAHFGTCPVFGYPCILMHDDDGELRAISLGAEEFVQ